MRKIKNYYIITTLVLLTHLLFMTNFLVSEADGFTGKFSKVSEKQIGLIKAYELVFEVDTWNRGEKIKETRVVFSPVKVNGFKFGKKYNIYSRKNWLIKSNSNS